MSSNLPCGRGLHSIAKSRATANLTEKIITIRTSRKISRHRSTTCPSAGRGISTSKWTGRPRASASRARTWKKMPGNSCITARPSPIPIILWSITTARARRFWKLCPSRICARRKKPSPIWRNSVPFCNIAKCPIAKWKRGVSAAMRIFPSVSSGKKNSARRRRLKTSIPSAAWSARLSTKRAARSKCSKKAAKSSRRRAHGTKKKA